MMNTRPVSIVPPGTAFVRYALSLIAAKTDPSIFSAVEFAGRFRDTPHVEYALRQKAVVPAGTTSTPAWAGVLTTSGISQETVPLLRGLSAFEAARPKMRELPFERAVARQTSTGSTAFWVQEGAAIPATSYAFDLLTLDALKLCAMVIVSAELRRFSDPIGEALFRDAMLTTLAEKVDATFLDPTVTGGSGSPASITSTGTAITSTGATTAAIQTDLAAMVGAISTSGAGLTWFMKPTTLAHIGLVLGGAAADIPRSLFALPVIASPNVGDRVVLADLAEIAFAAGDLDVALSDATAVEMLDNPTNSSTTPTGTTLVSLWQTNSACLKIMRFLNWQVIRTGSVAHMAVTF